MSERASEEGFDNGLREFREAALEDKIIRSEREIARLRAELRAAQDRERRLRAELDAIAASTSWRLTAPLRKINPRRSDD